MESINKNDNDKETKYVTLFLGNGFDLNLGLKTSYKDFIDCYINECPSSNSNVNKMKELISKNDMEWGDLELLLGKLTKDYDNAESFYEAFCDMGEQLLLYLCLEEDKKFEKKDDHNKKAVAHKLIDDLQIMFNAYVKDGQKIVINILTLNYTRIIDKIARVVFNNQDLKSILERKNIHINDIIHCHGSYIDKKICFGVNDSEQVNDIKIFNNKQRYFQQFLKPERNRIISSNNVDKARSIIINSDIIINYGCSFGETDKFWLNIISAWLGFIINKEVALFIDQVQNDKLRMKNKVLYVYSHQKRPKTFFDAEELQFDDNIRQKYSVANDNRIFIVDDNIFENLHNCLK